MVRDYGRDKANRTAKAVREHSTLLHRFLVRPAAPAANENNTVAFDATEQQSRKLTKIMQEVPPMDPVLI